ncbi:MAG: DUF2029 domain-containing protein [Bacteroidia bacterium]|nr:DUF2029 domain-containing protein [Bacteroidia bacterium]
MNKTLFIRFFSDLKIIFILYIFVTVFFTFKNTSNSEGKIFSGEKKYSYFNNYIIFKNSYFHLLQNKNLYSLYPEKQWDLYKYSPSFSAAMVLLAYLPDTIGVLIWNLINCLILFFALRYFIKGPPHIVFMLWLVLNEFSTSVLNSQSNAAIAGLVLFAFTMFEKEKLHWAALCIVCTFYIKIFGILAVLLFVFYPQKLKFLKWCIIWGCVLSLLPLIFTSFSNLFEQYKNWLTLLSNDHQGNYGYSFMGVLHSWFGLNSGKDLLVLLGLILLFVPLLFIKKINTLEYRINWLASLLIWLVIFNHKAESPTFIIAFCGIAIWYFSSVKNFFQTALLTLAILFTSLAPTDIFPVQIRKEIFEPYSVKAVPCILIWIYLIFSMIKIGLKKTTSNIET